MTKKEDSKRPKNSRSTTTPKNVNLHVEGSITESVVVIGDNNVIKYYSVVEKNIKENDPDYWNLKHPYPMPPNFTGRIAERAMLTQWLNDDSENRLFILRALGGFGKSALTWHWLTHDVDSKEWPKVVFWSFYEGDASFENFTRETVEYLDIKAPQGGRPQVDELLKAMQRQKILLIMDGFERALRTYSSMNAAYQGDEEPKLEDNQLDCVNINAEIFLKSICSLPNIKSKVVMTTRLTPRAVKPRGEFMLGCREEELTSMQPADAVEFFYKQKIKGTHAEIEAACAPYGYHPLSLRLLAGRIAKDFEKPYDIVIAQKLKIDADIIQQKHHVLEVSYNSLPNHEQKLLNTVACFRSPVELKTLEAIAENVLGVADRPFQQDDLHDLVERGLLHFDNKNKKFDVHPIVRRFAYAQLTASDKTNVHERIMNYFEAVPKIEKIEKMEDLAPIIELYYHAAKAERFDEAATIYYKQLQYPIYFQFNLYQIGIELLLILFADGEDKLPRINRSDVQAWALNEIGRMYARIGQPHKSIPFYSAGNRVAGNTRLSIFNERANSETKISFASGMSNLAGEERSVGNFKTADKLLRYSINLCREINHPLARLAEAMHRSKLGYLLSYCGMWPDAFQELKLSMGQLETLNHVQMQGVTWSEISLFYLLYNRSTIKQNSKNIKSAMEASQQALKLADEDARTDSPTPRDYVRAYWLLGAVYRINRDFKKAEENLFKAINICRQINLISDEADIILDLARLRYDRKNYEEAKTFSEEALSITERCGYVLQGADVNLFLAQYALEQEKDKVKAKEYAESALKLAYCDGPPYYYKVAYEEAVAMLEKLK